MQALEDGQAGDPDFLASIKTQGTDFSLTDGETHAVDLRVRQR